jgi:hypothetical protein
MPDAVSQDDEPHAIGSDEVWALNLPVEDDELVTEHAVLCDEFGLATREVCHHRENDRVARGLGEVAEGLIQGGEEIGEALYEPVEKVGHAN